MSRRTSSKMVRGIDSHILPKRAIDSERQRLTSPEPRDRDDLHKQRNLQGRVERFETWFNALPDDEDVERAFSLPMVQEVFERDADGYAHLRPEHLDAATMDRVEAGQVAYVDRLHRRASRRLPLPPSDVVPAQFSRAVDAQYEAMRFWAGPRAESVAAQILDMQDSPVVPPPAQFARDMLGALVSSEPFYVAPDICDLVGQTSVSWPDDALFAVAALPTRAAWVHFARPIALGNWTHTQHEAHPTVELVGMLLVRPSPASPKVAVSGYVRDGHGELAPVSWVMLGPEDTVAAVQTRFDDREHVLDRPHAVLQLVGAFLAFIDQKIAVQSRGHVDRATRRRLEREKADVPDVRVVTLRAARQVAHSGEPSRTVEWTCRWLVRGFWRQQPYGPRSALRRTVWVAPFPKGPAGKPFKAQAARLFAVAR